MYSTGNHIADGDYDEHAERIESYFANIRKQEFDQTYEDERATQAEAIEESGVEELLRYYNIELERSRKSHSDGAVEAYHQLIEELKNRLQ